MHRILCCLTATEFDHREIQTSNLRFITAIPESKSKSKSQYLTITMSDRYEDRRSEYDDDQQYHRKEKKYEERDFDSGRTKSIKKDYKQLWPKSGDPKEFKDYLRNERTGYYDPPARSTQGESDRRKATIDNRDADRVRRQNRISNEDFGYPKNDYLRHNYRTAKNPRDNPLTGEGSGNQDAWDGALSDRRRDS